MKFKKITASAMVLVVLSTTGCWDKVELDERAFINTITIDSNGKDGEEETKSDAENPFLETTRKSLKVTFGLLNPSQLQGGGEPFLPRTVEGENLPDAMEELGERTSRIPFFGQVRLFVIGEKVAKDKNTFKELLDDIERKATLNIAMKIVVLKGEAEKLAEAKPKLEQSVAAYVTGIMEGSKVVSSTINMGASKFFSIIRSNDGNGYLPYLEINKTSEGGKEESQLVLNKIALIKDYSMIGVLDTKYVRSFKLLNNDLDMGRKLVDYNGVIIPFRITSADKKMWLSEEGEKLKYNVKFEIEGDIDEYVFGEDIFDTRIIKDITQKLNESFTNELKETTKHFQQDIGADYLGFNEYTSKHNSKVYKKYENNWDDAFKKADIEYEVKVNIRRVGTARK